MKRRSLVSIVIPTYDRARDLERALRSVLAQTYCDWEALVVDNHSIDGTDAVIEGLHDARIRLYKVHNSGVIAVSRNVGIRHAEGDYVAFLDSDDWWSARKLEESVKRLEQGADAVYHDLFLVTKPGQVLFWRRARTRDVSRPVFRDLIVQGNALTNSSVVIRRDLLLAIDGLSEERSLISAEDYDAWLRVAQLSDRFERIPKTLGFYWAGGGGMSNPHRVLASLAAIEDRYAGAFRTYAEYGAAAWLQYARGRAYSRLGLHQIARQHFESIRWRRSSFGLALKAHLMLISSTLHHR